MAVTTALLVRYAGGYTVVEDAAAIAAWGRREGFLQLGGVSDRDQAERVALGVLAFQGAPRVTTTLGIEPTGTADNPYVDFVVGDSITAPDETGSSSQQRVVSLTVVEDDNGEVSFANELKAPFLIAEEAFSRQLKKLLNGSIGGHTQAANPLPTGSVTRADTGDSIGALRDYTNKQLLARAAEAQTTPNANTQSGSTWTPGTDQIKWIAESHVGTTGTGGSAGRLVITFPDGGFPNDLLAVIATLGDVPGVGAAILNVVQSNTDKTQVDVVAVDNAGAGISGGSIRVDYIALGW